MFLQIKKKKKKKRKIKRNSEASHNQEKTRFNASHLSTLTVPLSSQLQLKDFSTRFLS